MTSTANQSCQQFADHLRAVLAMGGPLPDASQLISQYQERVTEINTRLTTARAWLRSGLVCEAISLVEEFPDALQDAAFLDLGPDKVKFQDACRAAGFEPPAIDDEAAREVSSAYSGYSANQRLIAQYRVACLARANATLRLSLLKALIKAEPTSPIWSDQLGMTRALREREILDEARKAARDVDPRRIEALRAELQPAVWGVNPSPLVVQELQKLQSSAQRSADEAGLKDAAMRLHAAQNTRDAEVMRGAIQQMEAIEARGLVAVSPDTKSDFVTAANWLAGRDAAAVATARHVQLIEQMSTAIDENVAWHHIEPLRAEALLLNPNLPEALLRRLNVLEEEYRAARRAKRRVLAFVSVAMVLALGAVIFVVARSVAERGRIDELAKQLYAALENPDIAPAQALADKIGSEPSSVRESPTLAPLLARFKERASLAKSYSVSFEKRLTEVRSLDGTSEAHVRQSKTLQDDTANTAEQRSQASEEYQRIKRSYDALVAKADAEAEMKAREIQSRIAQAKDRLIAGGEDELLKTLSTLGTELDRVLALPNLSPEYLKSLQAVRNAITRDSDNVNERVRSDQSRRISLSRIENFSGDLVDLLKFLEDHNKRFLNDVKAGEVASFQNVLTNRAALMAAGDAYKSTAAFSESLKPTTIEDTRARIEVIKSLPVAAYPKLLPGDQAVLLAYLKSVEQSQSQPASERYADVLEEFGKGWWQKLRHITDRDGRRYFALSGILEPGWRGADNAAAYTLREVVNNYEQLKAEAAKSRSVSIIRLPAAQEVPIQPKTTSMSSLAPQVVSLFKDAANGKADPLTSHFRAAASLRDAQDIPAPLRAHLVAKVLKVQGNVPWPDVPGLPALIESLDEFNGKPMTLASWDESAQPGTSARAQVVAALQSAPDFNAEVERQSAELDRIRKGLRGLRVCAIAWPAEGGTVVLSKVVSDNTDLYQLLPAADGSPVAKKIGRTAERGVVQWIGAPPVQGTPILIAD